MDGLSGKTALVTGGGRGIGAEIARRLAAEGVSVGITYSASAAKAHDVVAEILRGGGDRDCDRGGRCRCGGGDRRR